MSDTDEKNGARSDKRGVISRRDSPDRIPVRNTAPAGTPAHKAPSGSALRVLSEPEQPIPAPKVREREVSERAPAVDTISSPRTLGGHTARLKAKHPPREEEPRPRERQPARSEKNRSTEDEIQAAVDSIAPSARRPDKGGAKPAFKGAKDGNWEADVRISEPAPSARQGPTSARAEGWVSAAASADSRWPFAIAIGAIAFAIGALLPLPFRKYIVASPNDAAVSAPIPLPSVARNPTPPPPRAPSAAPQAPAAVATASALSPPPLIVEKPSSTAAGVTTAAGATTAPGAATAAPQGTAAPNAPSSAGKGPGRGNGKPGRIGDIF